MGWERWKCFLWKERQLKMTVKLATILLWVFTQARRICHVRKSQGEGSAVPFSKKTLSFQLHCQHGRMRAAGVA